MKGTEGVAVARRRRWVKTFRGGVVPGTRSTAILKFRRRRRPERCRTVLGERNIRVTGGEEVTLT